MMLGAPSQVNLLRASLVDHALGKSFESSLRLLAESDHSEGIGRTLPLEPDEPGRRDGRGAPREGFRGSLAKTTGIPADGTLPTSGCSIVSKIRVGSAPEVRCARARSRLR